jgi:hypothetical protein
MRTKEVQEKIGVSVPLELPIASAGCRMTIKTSPTECKSEFLNVSNNTIWGRMKLAETPKHPYALEWICRDATVYRVNVQLEYIAQEK